MHIIWPPPGRYILAVSGGADSMVLLHLMADAAEEHGYELVVAHFDHGLRASSPEDRQFAQAAAQRLGLAFEHGEGQLGQGSEATARTARHDWLEQTRLRHHAIAIVTAHHQDDLIETSLLNLARGSGRRGLAPMQSGSILRPLLDTTRDQLRGYAKTHKITWREDPTNADTSNPRNFLRHVLLTQASPDWRSRYLNLVNNLIQLNTKITQSISAMTENARTSDKVYSFHRSDIAELSLTELEELIMHVALVLVPGIDLDRRVVQEVALFAKTAAPHRHRVLRNGLEVRVYRDSISVLTF